MLPDGGQTFCFSVPNETVKEKALQSAFLFFIPSVLSKRTSTAAAHTI
jgi:hypothetical protein